MHMLGVVCGCHAGLNLKSATWRRGELLGGCVSGALGICGRHWVSTGATGHRQGLLHPHDLPLFLSHHLANTAQQRVEVTPAVGSQCAGQAGRRVQLSLLLPACVQELLLGAAEPLQGLPVGK